MPRNLTPAQVRLLLSIDEATHPRCACATGLSLAASSDRTRLARERLIAGRFMGRVYRWSTTAAGKLRAGRERAEEAERRAAAP